MSEVAPQQPEVAPQQSGRTWGKPFQPGNSGRPKGSRNKLAEVFFEALTADFAQYGAVAIVRARRKSPLGYLKVVASVMPQKMEIERLAAQVTDAELLAIIRNVPALQLAAPIEPELVAVEADAHD